jgi:hypothetical protein
VSGSATASVLSKVGLSPLLTWDRLKTHCRDHHFAETLIRDLEKTHLDSTQKLIIILAKIEFEQPENLMLLIQQQYGLKNSESQVTVENVLNYYQKLSQAKTTDELLIAYLQPPDGLTTNAMALIWKKVIKPILAELDPHLSIYQFYLMDKRFNKLWIHLASQHEVWSEHWREQFIEYLAPILKDQCKVLTRSEPPAL